jgi:hypothetical protein
VRDPIVIRQQRFFVRAKNWRGGEPEFSENSQSDLLLKPFENFNIGDGETEGDEADWWKTAQ